MNKIKPLVFAAVTILHIALIMFVSFRAELPAPGAEPGVMRLVDVQEELPPPPPSPPPPLPPPPLPPPPSLPPPEISGEVTESIAETFIETDDILPQETTAPVSAPVQPQPELTGQGEYLRRHQISALPLLPEEQIARAIVYPRNAQRLNIEGMVTLELFIDREGTITDVRVLRETPLNRGFGQAAVNAFRGIRALRPAELNGVPVAVRFQYNVRFTLR